MSRQLSEQKEGTGRGKGCAPSQKPHRDHSLAANAIAPTIAFMDDFKWVVTLS